MLDFTSYAHPVLAVACPTCRAGAGARCVRPSGHRGFGGAFHQARGELADTLFMDQHGVEASIERRADGSWWIDPTGYRHKDDVNPSDMEAAAIPEAPAQLSLWGAP
jgi:hypothetical protein